MQAKPAVLFIGNFLSSAGFSPSAGESLATRLQSAGYRVIATSSKVNKFARLFGMLWSIWRWRHVYQVAHVEVFSGSAFIWAEWSGWLLRLLGKPYVLALHGGSLPEFSQRHARRVADLLSSANAVVAPSGYLKEKLENFREDIQIIPNGLDISPYPFRLRAEPVPSMVWLRAFHNIYNPQMAVDVVSRLVSDFPGLHLQMIGPDKDGSLAETQRLAEEQGVGRHILFSGRIEKAEVPLRLNEGDIFINTTSIDNTPVSVIEAMACGMCIVSTDVGGLPFLLEHEVDALLVPAGNIDAMAAAVRRILTEPELAARLSRNARIRVETFDWSMVLPLWESLFSAIAVGR